MYIKNKNMIQRGYMTHKLNFYSIERSVLNCCPSMSSKDNLEETPALQAKVHKINEHRFVLVGGVAE